MKYAATHMLGWTGVVPDGFDRNLELQLLGGQFRIIEFDEDEKNAIVEIVVPVAVDGLVLRSDPLRFDEFPTQDSIEVPELSKALDLAQTAAWLLSFLTDIPFQYSGKWRDGLRAENAKEAKLLASFGVDRVYHETSALWTSRSFSLPSVSQDVLEKLLNRRFGLALYSEALLLRRPLARYRELWRLVESAFGLKEVKLVDVLASFAPARDLGFDRAELESLRVLRGRASHAESRIGLEEHRRVALEAEKTLPRLKCLAEQLLMTKKTWGSKDTGVDRLAGLAAYVSRNGALTFFMPKSES